MTDQHVKGIVNTTRGKVEEELGKLSGDKLETTLGEARQAQGHAQKGLGDVQDLARRPKNKP